MTTIEKIEIVKAVATFVAALLVFGGGFWTYSYQRSILRADQLREKKQAAYEAYLHALYMAAMERNRSGQVAAARSVIGTPLSLDSLFADEKAHDDFQRAKLSVFMLAPDEVVRAAGRYQKLIEGQTNGLDRRFAFADMVKAMRRDSFESTSLTIEEVVSLSPINHPGDS